MSNNQIKPLISSRCLNYKTCSSSTYLCLECEKINCTYCDDEHRNLSHPCINVRLTSLIICEGFMDSIKIKQSEGSCNLNFPKLKCNECNLIFCIFEFFDGDNLEFPHSRVHNSNSETLSNKKVSESKWTFCTGRCVSDRHDNKDANLLEVIQRFFGKYLYKNQIIYEILSKLNNNSEKYLEYFNQLFLSKEKNTLKYLIQKINPFPEKLSRLEADEDQENDEIIKFKREFFAIYQQLSRER
jgi:hypothetical protein